jgi:hypothetical protein
MSTLRACRKSIVREFIEPQAIVPHDLAFGVGADAREVEKDLNQGRGRKLISVGLVEDGHEDAAIGDTVDHNLWKLLIYAVADKALASAILDRPG